VLIFGLENVIVIWLARIAVVMDGSSRSACCSRSSLFKLLFITRVNNLVDKWIEFRMLDLHAERIADIALADRERGCPAGCRAPSAQRRFVHRGARELGFAYGIEGFVFRGWTSRPARRDGGDRRPVGYAEKTTLVKVLAGLLDRTEGTLTAAAATCATGTRPQYRSRIGVVMQDDQLFVGTIEDNISFFDPQHDPERVRECARLAMIDEDISAMPMGYNTIVGSLGVALSGGQRSRVLLARALYRQPQILFLDETFDQLDLARERAITDGLKAHGHWPGDRQPPAGDGRRGRPDRPARRSVARLSRPARPSRRAGSSATPGTAPPSACARSARPGTATRSPPHPGRRSRSGSRSPSPAAAPPEDSAAPAPAATAD
jgi:ATP-binding cassette subfamily B protein RaxB